MSDTKKLRILSLDGGGIRGLSSLLILQSLMWQAGQEMNPPRGDLQPYEYFDLIGGTSTGGIIAIMLGRLRMSVQECIDEYRELSEKVFSKRRGPGHSSMFDASKLEEATKTVIKKKLGKNNADVPLLDPLGQYCCKTVVYTLPRANVSSVRPTALRTYTSKTQIPMNCTIWQAIRATSAAPTFFEPARFGGKYWVDAALGFNNPCEIVKEEVDEIWGDRSGTIDYNQVVGLFISIGTGLQSPARLNEASFKARISSKLQIPIEAVEAMEKIVTGTETAALVLERFFSKGIFHRFNVEQGLQDVRLFEYERLEDVEADTNNYLQHRRAKVSECILTMISVRNDVNVNDPPAHQAGNEQLLLTYENHESDAFVQLDFNQLELKEKVGIGLRQHVRNRKKMEAHRVCQEQLCNVVRTSYLFDRIVLADLLDKDGREIIDRAHYARMACVPMPTGSTTASHGDDNEGDDRRENLHEFVRQQTKGFTRILIAFQIYAWVDLRLRLLFDDTTDYFWNMHRLAGVTELMGLRRDAMKLYTVAAAGRAGLLGDEHKATQRSREKVLELQHIEPDLIDLSVDDHVQMN